MISQSTMWERIDAQLSTFLSDSGTTDGTTVTYLYDQPQRISAWNWSLSFLTMHTPRQRKVLLVVDADERSAVLPPDFLEVWRIYDADEKRWMYRKRKFNEGAYRYDDDEVEEFWLWGGDLLFERSLTIGASELTLYYYAYWPEISYEEESGGYTILDGEILCPPWAVAPLCHLTSAFCLIPGAIQAARTRQWNIRIDSGTPLDNSRAQQAREHVWWWNTLVNLAIPLDWR